MPRPRVLLSVHDVAPPFLKPIQDILGLLHHLGFAPPALLVVPRYHRRVDLRHLPDFTMALRGWLDAGSELILHGHVHLDDSRPEGLVNRLKARFLTAGEGEFLSLSQNEALRRILDGREILESTLGHRPVGFIAPAWLQGEASIRAIEQSGLSFYETHTHLVRVRPAQRTRSVVINWATRTAPRRWASIAYSEALLPSLAFHDVLRVAIHPPDILFPETRRALVRLLTRLRQSHQDIRYQDWLDESRSRL